MAEASFRRVQTARVIFWLVLLAACHAFAQQPPTNIQSTQISGPVRRPDVLLQAGNTGMIRALAISPGLRWIASGGQDKSVVLWNATTGAETGEFPRQGSEVIQLLFSPDGRQLAVTGFDGRVRIYDVASRKQLYSATINKLTTGPGGRVTYSPDGRFWVAGAGRNDLKTGMAQIELHDTVTGEVVKTLKTDWFEIFALAITPDGRLLGSGSTEDEYVQPDGSVHVWNLQTGEILNTWPIAADAFSADGRWMGKIDYSKSPHQAIVWDLPTGRQKLSVPLKNEQAIYFSPDGNQFALTDPISPQMMLVSTATGEVRLLGPAPGPGSDGLSAVAFSSDSKIVAAAPYVDRSIKLWDANSGKELWTLYGQAMVQGITLTKSGTELLTGSPHGVDVWEVATGKRSDVLPFGYVNSFVASSNGRWLAINPGVHFAAEKLAILDMRSKKVAAEFSFHSGGNPVHGMAFVINDSPLKELGPISRSFEFTTDDGKHTVWSSPSPVASSPDGKLLAIQAGGTGNVDVWDLVTGRKVTTIAAHGGYVNGVDFSADGRWLLTTGQESRIVPGYMPPRDWKPERGVKLWEVGTWQPKMVVTFTAAGGACAALSRDGHRVAIEKAWDRVDLYDVATGTLLESLAAKDPNPNYHQFAEHNVLFSADGKMVFQGAQNGIRVWKVTK